MRRLAFASTALISLLAPLFAYANQIYAPSGGQTRALLVGVNDYRFVRPLKGAVADALDIERALKSVGVKDVSTLLNEGAERSVLFSEMEKLIQRSKPGDLIILSFAGHGSQEPERVKGSEPDGLDEVFLLAGFNPAVPQGTTQRVLDKEFNVIIKRLEERGATVIFVADSCHGGGMARSVDPRGNTLDFRQVPRFQLSQDDLKPISTAKDAFLTPLDFERSFLLAAVDTNTKSPEIRISGVPEPRGALSYAFARAVEGAADANHDAKTSIIELYSFLRQLCYQLSEQRQSIDPQNSPNIDISSTYAFFSQERNSINLSSKADNPEFSVAIALSDNNTEKFADMMRDHPYIKFVRKESEFDLLWDISTGDLISGGDIIAQNATSTDIPLLATRFQLIRKIRSLLTEAPQPVALKPSARTISAGERVDLTLGELTDRYLIALDLTGDGTIQLLYPTINDPARVNRDAVSLPLVVSPPFGADQIVAISSEQPLTKLVEALQRLDQTRGVSSLLKSLSSSLPEQARLGTVSIFTKP